MITDHENKISTKEVFEMFEHNNEERKVIKLVKRNKVEGFYKDYKIISDQNGAIFSSDFGTGEPLSKLNSRRTRIFIRDLSCIHCGIKGEYFAKTFPTVPEGATQTSHLNLFAVEDDEPLLMTIDHIVPKSKGGSDNIENLVTCCSTCNFSKKSLNKTWDEIREVILSGKSFNKKQLKVRLDKYR